MSAGTEVAVVAGTVAGAGTSGVLATDGPMAGSVGDDVLAGANNGVVPGGVQDHLAGVGVVLGDSRSGEPCGDQDLGDGRGGG